MTGNDGRPPPRWQESPPPGPAAPRSTPPVHTPPVSTPPPSVPPAYAHPASAPPGFPPPGYAQPPYAAPHSTPPVYVQPASAPPQPTSASPAQPARPSFQGLAPPSPMSGATPLVPGMVLNNTHRIDQLLGRGGMGEVYRGANVHTGDAVAIKVIRPELVDDGPIRDLFLREANALRRIRHPAIVSYEGASADPGGRLYLVMDFVEGQSLAHMVVREPLTVPRMRALRRRLAEGLLAAHEQNVVHRDLSPDNIVLPGGDLNRAVIIDFGIAKRTDGGKTSIIGNSFAGKLEYAAPEQLGMFGGVVDARSDIYTLALVLMAAMLGRPFDMGDSAAAAIAARSTVPDLSSFPAAVRPEFAAMLQPNPARRLASMRDVLALDGGATPGSFHPTAAGAGGGRGRLAWIAGGGVVAALAMAAAVFAFGSSLWRSAPTIATAPAQPVKPSPPNKAASTPTPTPTPVPGPKTPDAGAEERAWAAAVAADTVAGYRDFLQNHPTSPRAAEAGRRMAIVVERDSLREFQRRNTDAAAQAEARRRQAELEAQARATPTRPPATPLPTQPVWSAVPCTAIPIMVPAGFQCQTSADFSMSGAGRYGAAAFGGTVNGWQTYVWLYEPRGEGGHSVVAVAGAADALRTLNALTTAGTYWSEVGTYGGAEYMTFRSGFAQCVAFRKFGPARPPGYAYAFTGVQCAPQGYVLGEADIRTTIDAVRRR